MAGININQGTQTNIAADAVGTVNYQTIKLDVGAAGASSLFTGTLGAVTNLAGGTVTALAKGTISTGTFAMTTGTVSVGTVDAISQLPPNYFGTVVTTGTNTLGTIKGSVAGSAIYVTDLIVSVGSATTLVIGNGGTDLPLIGTLSFAQYGGMVANFKVPIFTSAGSALVYKQSVGCTLSITAQGYVK